MTNALRTDQKIGPGPGFSCLTWGLIGFVLIVLLIGNTPVDAADEEPTVTSTETIVEDAPNDEGKQCTWACLKWSKLCNVDPRGVYKCRRTCANFGEVCE